MRAVGVPGGGGVSTAADLALFYQALLHDPLGMWKPDVLSDVTTNVRNSFPDYMGTPANRTLGLIVKGDDERSHMRGMGRTVSPRAFGHNGAAGQIAWADPETGVSFCFLTNGIDEHELRQWRRGAAIANRAGNCVDQRMKSRRAGCCVVGALAVRLVDAARGDRPARPTAVGQGDGRAIRRRRRSSTIEVVLDRMAAG